MPRYKLTIEYDGTPFCGWQRQNGQPSVQRALEKAIFAFSGKTVATQAAGRTDSGVHALAQVVHFDIEKQWESFRIGEALNHHVKPSPIAVLSVELVDAKFHARFSATARHYEYRILNRRAPPAIERNRAWHVSVPLDADAMHEAAQTIVGTHDFTTFRAAECQARSPLKTLQRLDVSREADIIVVRATARSFLHRQVRSMVGSLKLTGDGKWSVPEVKRALDACDRARCGPLAPPAGLFLARVDYPGQDEG